MLRWIKLLMILALILPNEALAQGELDRYPGGANILFNLHTNLKRYFSRLREVYPHFRNGQGCEVYDESMRLCAQSHLSVDATKLTNRIFFISKDQTYLTLVLIHEGEQLKTTPVEDLLRFQFRQRGHSLIYEAQGITQIRFTWNKFDKGEKALLYYPPINFILEHVSMKEQGTYRKSYNTSCYFCGGPEWIEARAYERVSLPLDIQFYSADEPDTITPRAFDSHLASQFYRPLSGLASSLPRELVSEGQFPDVKF